MSKELLAKDKRRWSKRKGIVTAAWVAGGLALAGLGYVLYRKLFYDRPPAPGATKDWSGCFDPPSWVQPRPRFSCGQHVISQTYYGEGAEAGVDGSIDARTWTANTGTWQYSILWSSDVYEEGQLEEA